MGVASVKTRRRNNLEWDIVAVMDDGAHHVVGSVYQWTASLNRPMARFGYVFKGDHKSSPAWNTKSKAMQAFIKRAIREA